jgi:UDP-N-acetylglucosamine 4,6-dehydratase
VVGSRGSVVPVFLRQRAEGRITLTDRRMTRFWLSLEQGVRFTIRCLEQMQGGEVFIPKIPSMRLTDLAEAVAPGSEIDLIGIRPGEKLHEVLVSEEEARHSLELEDMYVVEPPGALWFGHAWKGKGKPLAEGFRYASDSNEQWLTAERLGEMLGSIPELGEDGSEAG